MSVYDREEFVIDEFQKRIKHYRYQHRRSPDPAYRMHMENLISDELDQLVEFLQQVSFRIQQQQVLQRQPQKSFSLEELSQYDGTNGKPTYVAVKGIVYDLSLEPTWGGGSHFGLEGGRDLASNFESCHAAQGFLTKLPVVGVLNE